MSYLKPLCMVSVFFRNAQIGFDLVLYLTCNPIDSEDFKAVLWLTASSREIASGKEISLQEQSSKQNHDVSKVFWS